MDQFPDGAIFGCSVDYELVEGNQFTVLFAAILPLFDFVELWVV